jgi:hypothetical protein
LTGSLTARARTTSSFRSAMTVEFHEALFINSAATWSRAHAAEARRSRVIASMRMTRDCSPNSRPGVDALIARRFHIVHIGSASLMRRVRHRRVSATGKKTNRQREVNDDNSNYIPRSSGWCSLG